MVVVETISNSFILYSSATGNLIYNENGSTSGFGDGGVFANLTNAPNLTGNSTMGDSISELSISDSIKFN